MTELHAGSRTLTARHPLDRLTADEIRAAAAVLREAGLVGETDRFPVLALEEPPKAEVLAFTGSTAGSAPCCWTPRPVPCASRSSP